MILVAMQYYSGDFREAMDAARLYAEILESPVEDYFLFAYRKDAPEPDKETVNIVQSKFKRVMFMRGTRSETGWPDGCNGLWHEMMVWAAGKRRDNPNYNWDAVLTVESDSVPTNEKYLYLLQREFDRIGKPIIGCIVTDSHINGNMLIDPQVILDHRELCGTPYGTSWDTHHADLILSIGEHTHLIRSEHRTMTITKEELYKTPCVIFHGVKDGSARDIVRRKFGLLVGKSTLGDHAQRSRSGLFSRKK